MKHTIAFQVKFKYILQLIGSTTVSFVFESLMNKEHQIQSMESTLVENKGDFHVTNRSALVWENIKWKSRLGYVQIGRR